MPEGKGQVTVPVPPGMSEEEFLKLFSTFQKARVTGKVKDTAFRATLARMKAKYATEWDKVYAEEYTRAGG